MNLVWYALKRSVNSFPHKNLQTLATISKIQCKVTCALVILVQDLSINLLKTFIALKLMSLSEVVSKLLVCKIFKNSSRGNKPTAFQQKKNILIKYIAYRLT